jgi:hypothetical protein
MTGQLYIDDALRVLRQYRGLAERAAAQVDDEAFFTVLDAGSNSIALLMKHVGGNMRSRFTDFLNTDGEKPDRNRDAEFELGPGDTRERVLAIWDDGWRRTMAAIEALTPDDLARTVTVRGEPMTALSAINRQIAHYAYHVGQIVLLAKHFAGADWQTLSIPKRDTGTS